MVISCLGNLLQSAEVYVLCAIVQIFFLNWNRLIHIILSFMEKHCDICRCDAVFSRCAE